MNMDLELPGGVITTHCVSSVIRPGSKVTHDPLQFVKIQSAELSKKAVEQIRLAEEVKITKDKIKEVEEEWQNNLLNWKSKRRQSRSTNCPLNSESLGEESEDPENPRKIKTFSEILNEKAKSGYRIGYNLSKYIRNGSEDDEDEEEDEDEGCKMMEDDSTSRLSSSSDDSSNTKKMIDSAISENLANTLISESLRVKDGKHEDENDNDGDDDDDGDDETAHDSVVDRSVKLVNQSTNCWRSKVAIQCQSDGDNNKLIEQQINLKNNSHNVDGNCGNVNHHNQHNNQVNSNNNKQLDEMDSSKCIKPLNTNFRRNEICRINSYNCANSINNETNKQTGRRVILKFKIEKDITKDGQENEPRLSFRDKLSNFESLAKGEDIASSCHLNNQLNQSSLNHPKERKLSVTESSQSTISGQTVSTSSSSSSLHLNSEQIKNSTEIPNPDLESTSSNSNIFPDLSPKPKPALPPRPAIGERKSLPVDTKLHQNVSRTSSDSSANAVSDKIHNNYFRFATKPYTNPRIVKSNGNKPVVCLQGSLSSITSTSSSSSSSSPPSSSSTSLSLPFQETSNSSGPNNIKSNTNSINSNSNEDDDTKFSNSRTASNSHNAIKTSIKSNNNSINSSTSTPATTSDTVTAVNGLTKASFKHLSLSPQTSNSSVNSCNSNRTGSPLTTSAQLDSITTTNTIPDSGRPSSHQGSPQIIDIRTSNGTRSSNGQGDGEKSFSEAQLIKKSNENLKSHDQRSMLSISGKKKCSNCGDELGRGCAAMVIETLSLYYHINCFRCSVCHIQLGNGTCGTDVRVRSNRLHCQNCYSNDEVGLTRV
uniref:LIM zinc-binding domain-containing protein n=1 Tax=Tetranychus urticae TaxID=32264 RepID=T1K9A4_TETUR